MISANEHYLCGIGLLLLADLLPFALAEENDKGEMYEGWFILIVKCILINGSS